MGNLFSRRNPSINSECDPLLGSQDGKVSIGTPESEFCRILRCIFCCCCSKQEQLSHIVPSGITEPSGKGYNTFAPQLSITIDWTHIPLIEKNYCTLVKTLQPQLFARSLKPNLSKGVLDPSLSKEDQVRKLLDNLQRTPRSYFDGFCQTIAALHPDVFVKLTGRRPTVDELSWYLKPFADKLKAGILATGSRPDNDIDPEINLDTQFVKLRLVDSPTNVATPETPGSNRYERVFRCCQDNSLEVTDILCDHSPGKTILITGRGGVGKSTLVQYLNRLWASGKWATSYSVVFLLNLRHLAHLTEKNLSLAQLLGMYAVYVPDPPDTEPPPLEWLEQNPEQVLLFLDGIDELSGISKLLRNTRKLSTSMQASPLELCINIMRRTLMSRSTLFLVSRPFSDLSQIQHDNHFDILGFTPETIERFIDLNVRPDRQRIVKKTLERNHVLLSTCAIAFYCAKITKIIEDDDDIDSESLNTYSRITAFIITWYASRQAFLETRAALLSKDLVDTLPNMAALAHKGLILNEEALPDGVQILPKMMFNEEDLNQIRFFHEDLMKARRTGLLICREINKVKRSVHHAPRQEVEFVHLLIQELFCAGQIITETDESIEEYLHRDNTGQGHLDMTTTFLCGLALDAHCPYIRAITDAIRSGTNNTRGNLSPTIEDMERIFLNHLEQFSDRMLDSDIKLHCLQLAYESQQVKLARRAAGIISDNIATVKITNILMTAVDMKALFFTLQNSNNITQLSLEHIALDVASLEQLQKYLPRTRLSSICLKNNNLTDKGLEYLSEGIKGTPRFACLVVEENKASDAGMVHIASLVKQSSLKELRLINCCCYEEDIQQMSSALVKGSKLTKLVLSPKTIDDITMEHLSSGLVHGSALKHFQLMHVKVSPVGMKHLAEGLSKSHLTHLALWHIQINYKAMKYLAGGIKGSRTLKHLSLANNSLNFDCLKVLVESIEPSTNLHHLVLYRNELTAEGMSQLCKAVESASGLTHLQLLETGLKDCALAHLATALRNSPSLQCLQIGCDRVTDQGVNYLAEALRSKVTLTHLQLIKVRISAGGMGLLKRKVRINFEVVSSYDLAHTSTIEACNDRFTD